MAGADLLNRSRPLAVAGAVVGLVMVVVYLSLITAEDDDPASQIVPWAVAMAVPCVLAFLASLRRFAHAARWLLVGATVMFAGLGILAVFSIGTGFLVAAVLTGLSASMTVSVGNTPSSR